MSLDASRPPGPSARCFDAGSTYCPCDLAALGHCVACSLLRGEDSCICGWSGLCVYQEFLRSRRTPRPRRESLLAEVVERGDLRAQGQARAFILKVAVPAAVCAWCVFPGSFALLRPRGSPERFNVPLSVMEARGDRLTFAVEVKGPKTVALDSACAKGRLLTAVAPFWSGLQGAGSLSRLAAGKVLAVAKGIGQAAALHAGGYVLGRGGAFKALLGPGVLGQVFVDDLLRKEGALVEVMPRSKDHNIARIYSELCSESYDLLISEGSDQQHRALSGLLSSLEEPPAFAWSSNMPMTCAEGICGACLKDGARGCKADRDAGSAQEL